MRAVGAGPVGAGPVGASGGGAAARAPRAPVHRAAYRALVATLAPLAALTASLRAAGRRDVDLVAAAAVAGQLLAAGFAAPTGSATRTHRHRRAWVAVRELDRTIARAARAGAAPPAVIAAAQRAVDRADVLVAALPGVLPA